MCPFNYYGKISKYVFLISMFLTFNFLFILGYENPALSFDSKQSTTEGRKPDKCANNRTSCAYQISGSFPGVSKDSCCLVKYNGSSPDCDTDIFKGENDPDDTLGKALLFPFILYDKRTTYNYIAFNITFEDIKWSRLRIRAYETGSSNVPDLCQEIQLSYQVTSLSYCNETSFYDCLWTYDVIESKAYHLQYIAYPLSGEPAVAHEYVFFVPNTRSLGIGCDPCPSFRNSLIDINEVELFLYVDVSFLPQLRLYVQTPHPKYNISKYKIELVRSLVHNTWEVASKVISVFPNESYFIFTCDTSRNRGIYNFTVQPLSDSCNKGGCIVSKAPGIVIVNSTPTELLIGMVAAVMLIPILIAVYLMFKKKMNPIEGIKYLIKFIKAIMVTGLPWPESDSWDEEAMQMAIKKVVGGYMNTDEASNVYCVPWWILSTKVRKVKKKKMTIENASKRGLGDLNQYLPQSKKIRELAEHVFALTKQYCCHCTRSLELS